MSTDTYINRITQDWEQLENETLVKMLDELGDIGKSGAQEQRSYEEV